MPGLKHLQHKSLIFMKPKEEVTEGANDLIGAKSNGKVDTDSSYKITNGGSVLIKSDPTSDRKVNNSSINPKIKNKNKSTLNSLVRIAF